MPRQSKHDSTDSQVQGLHQGTNPKQAGASKKSTEMMPSRKKQQDTLSGNKNQSGSKSHPGKRSI